VKKQAGKKTSAKRNGPLKSNQKQKQLAAAPHVIGFGWQLSIVLGITAIAFLPALQAGFVNWDDPAYITENEQIKQLSWQSVTAIFSSAINGNYNPMPIFTFAIENHFFGLNPFIYHFDNWLLHLACTALFCWLLRMLNFSTPAVFLGGILFGIHPMRVESVAWVTERKDVLFGAFYLAAVITYVKYVSGTRKIKWYLFTLLFAVLSLFSKVQAVSLPLSLICLDFFLNRKWLSAKLLIIEKLPFWLLSISFGIINVLTLKHASALSSPNSVVNYSGVDRLAVGAYSYAVYLLKFLFPWQMLAIYPYPLKLPSIAYVCLVLIPLLVIFFLWWSWKNDKITLLFGWGFFTANIVFLLQIIGAGQGFLADRFTYIAYGGLIFIVAKLYEQAISKWSTIKPLINVLAGIYLLILAVVTNQQSKVWLNDETLWTHVVKNNPLAIDAWKNLGFYDWKKKNDLSSALSCYGQALDLEKRQYGVKSTTYNAVANINRSLAEQSSNAGQKSKFNSIAIENYSLALKQDSADGIPDKKFSAIMHVNRGVALASAGKVDEAFNDFAVTVQLDPKNKYGYLNLAQVYLGRGENESALMNLNSFLKIDSTNADVFFKRGHCERLLGNNEAAITDFTNAIALKNSDGNYFLERARAYEHSGNHPAAKQDALQAKQRGLNPESTLLN